MLYRWPIECRGYRLRYAPSCIDRWPRNRSTVFLGSGDAPAILHFCAGDYVVVEFPAPGGPRFVSFDSSWSFSGVKSKANLGSGSYLGGPLVIDGG
jgi:hypothetical protein